LRRAKWPNELSHDGTETVNEKNSKAKPHRLPGVGSGDLGILKFITQKSPAKISRLAAAVGLATASGMYRRNT